MSDDQKDQLGRVFMDVLEQMAFMFGDSATSDDFQEITEEVLVAQMEIHGAMHGSIQLAVPLSMCPELAANFLGTEPEDAEDPRIYKDALKELLNVTCGNVLTTLAGEGPVFDLTVPEITELAPVVRESIVQDDSTAYILVDDHPIAIRLSIEEAT
jgi:CheY-specific phosphatase CheX